jgi:Transposase DDE domain
MNPLQTLDDWEILLSFLPAGWAEKAVELGALARKRKIVSAETLLRILLIHLADGKSLRTTAAYSQEVELCDINDVALLHRLRASESWFKWMSQMLVKGLKNPGTLEPISQKFRVRIVDGTAISEPGSMGSDWRVHYCVQLPNLQCDTFTITGSEVGEDFQRYYVEQGDLLIADRGYCKRAGICHVLDNGGDVLVRFHSSNLPLFSYKGKPVEPLKYLRTLEAGKYGDWNVWFRSPVDNQLIKGRLCAIRKSKEAIEIAKKTLRTKASRQQRELRPETLEHAEYVSLFTTVNRFSLKAEDILNLYRDRWQIELVFKRLKGIIGVGNLPKQNPESSIAWLQGKLFVALLVERLHQEAEFFSPWGYPISSPA